MDRRTSRHYKALLAQGTVQTFERNFPAQGVAGRYVARKAVVSVDLGVWLGRLVAAPATREPAIPVERAAEAIDRAIVALDGEVVERSAPVADGPSRVLGMVELGFFRWSRYPALIEATLHADGESATRIELSAIANGGVFAKPRLAKKAIDAFCAQLDRRL